MDNEVLNLDRAVELFGVSERTMIKLLREESVPARKIGREWRFSKAALLKWLGEGDSVDYLSRTELYRVANDTQGAASDLLALMQSAVDKLTAGGGNMRTLLPEMEQDICLPNDATLRVSYKKQREIEKLTFKIFWLVRD